LINYLLDYLELQGTTNRYTCKNFQFYFNFHQLMGSNIFDF